MSDREAIRDILLKAAEDVQGGMWCTGYLFKGRNNLYDALFEPRRELQIEMALKTPRCAEGSIGLASAIMGLDQNLAQGAIQHVSETLGDLCDQSGPGVNLRVETEETNWPCNTLFHHNDHHMEGMGAFEAGQHLAEVFRVAADRL